MREELGLFANISANAIRRDTGVPAEFAAKRRGFLSRILERLQLRATVHQPRLVVVERVNLAARQQLSLVEADGQRLLIATSPDGPPRICLLNRRSSIRKRREDIPLEGTVA